MISTMQLCAYRELHRSVERCDYVSAVVGVRVGAPYILRQRNC